MKPYGRHLLIALTLALAAAGAHAVRGAVPLVERPRVELLGNEGKIERVRAAIVKGSAKHRWTVDGDQPGALTLRQSKGDIQLLVMVSYDANGYQAKYLSSTGLYYDAGADGAGAKIHPTYNNWMKNLDAAITAALPEVP